MHRYACDLLGIPMPASTFPLPSTRSGFHSPSASPLLLFFRNELDPLAVCRGRPAGVYRSHGLWTIFKTSADRCPLEEPPGEPQQQAASAGAGRPCEDGHSKNGFLSQLHGYHRAVLSATAFSGAGRYFSTECDTHRSLSDIMIRWGVYGTM